MFTLHSMILLVRQEGKVPAPRNLSERELAMTPWAKWYTSASIGPVMTPHHLPGRPSSYSRMGWERLKETGLRIAPGFLCARRILRTHPFLSLPGRCYQLQLGCCAAWAMLQFCRVSSGPHKSGRGALGTPDEQGVHVAVGLYLGGNQLSGEMTYGVLGRVKTEPNPGRGLSYPGRQSGATCHGRNLEKHH